MQINKNEINFKKEILINEEFKFNDLGNIGIKSINSAHFDGRVYYNAADELKIEGTFHGELVLIDATDLSDVLYPITINIDEIIENNENILDINEILWENIVLEVPIRITNKDLTKLVGDGWETFDDLKKQIDPRLKKLEDLFKGGE